VEEKGKKASHHTRIGMDFDSKTSKLRDQEVVDKYLASYEFHLNSGTKIKFCPRSVDVSSAPPKGEDVYMQHQVLALGLRLPMQNSSALFWLFTKSPLLVVGGSLVHGSRVRGPL